MNNLNDNELDILIREAKANPPQPSAEFNARVMRTYESQPRKMAAWRRLFVGRFAIPIPAGVAAAIVLILLGMVLGTKLKAKPPAQVVTIERSVVKPTVETHTVEKPVMQQRVITKVVYRPRPTLDLSGLEPVKELRPRVIRSGG